MRMKLFVAGLLASTILSTAAIAQSQSEPTPAREPGATQTTPPPAMQRMEPVQQQTTTTMQRTAPVVATGQWRASKLVGVDVYNTANEKIGDISEVLLDPSGKVTGVIIGVGGFLGIGQHDVLVQLEQIKFVNEPVRSASTTTTTTTTTTGTNVPAATATTTTRPARDASERWYPDHAVMNSTKDQLKAMPAFKYN